MFEVLVYLYENYGALTACPDSDSLSQSLVAAGFESSDVSEALVWLQGLARVTEDLVTLRGASDGSFRVYANFETRRLGPAAIGFLSFLENEGQLTPSQREIVIERALATDEKTVPLAKLKVIVLMVLWSQSADIDILLLEELLDDGEDRLLQ
jgi:Smg protein